MTKANFVAILSHHHHDYKWIYRLHLSSILFSREEGEKNIPKK